MSFRKTVPPLIVFLALGGSFSQAQDQRFLVSKPVFDVVAGEYSGEIARDIIRHIAQFHRVQASPGMHQAVEYVEGRLRELGLEDIHVEAFVSDGQTRYQTYVSPLAWTVREGELYVEEPFAERLCRFSEVPVCLSTLSHGGEWRGELVDVGDGRKSADYQDKDVRGKIVFAYGYAGEVHREAVIHRVALGVVIYPKEDDLPEHPDLVRYNGLWPKAEEKDKGTFGFQISARQRDRLRAALAAGKKVVLRAKVDAQIHPGNLEVTTAVIRGRELPDQEILFVAHLDHYKPGANDNASGSAAILEIARTIKTLIADGKIPPPKRTLRFLWVPEHFGTIAYLNMHPDFGKHTLAAFNLDMVGEDTHKTNSRLRITRTPDSLPSWFNDLVENVAEQVAEANLVAHTGTQHLFHYEVTPYDLGSDHDMLNDSAFAVPAAMLGHWPDWTHHTNEDSVDKVDPTTLLRAGVLAAAGALWIANADEAEAQRLLTLMKSKALARIGSRGDRLATQREETAIRSLTRLSDSPRLKSAIEETAAKMRQAATAMGWVAGPPVVKPKGNEGRVPYRNFRGPLADSYGSQWFRDQLGTKYARWEELKQRVGEERFELIVYETANFANSERTIAEIEEFVLAEYPGTPAGVVGQIVEQLADAGLMGYVVTKDMITKPSGESGKSKSEREKVKPAQPAIRKRE